MHLVHYLATHRIHVPAGTIFGYAHDGLIDLLLDEDEINPRLIAAFSMISNTITAVLEIRNDPGPDPWCPIVIDRRPDLGDLEKIRPQLIDGSIVLPVPAGLITARMALAATVVSTNLTRNIERPRWLDGEEPPPWVITEGV